MNAFGAGDLERERAEEDAAADFGCHVQEIQNELLRGEIHAGRDDVEGDEDFELRFRFVERFVGGGELAVGEAVGGALRGFGPVLLEVEQHLALAGGEATGLACGVLARLHFALELNLVLHAAEVDFSLVERACGSGAAGLAGFGEGRPAAAEDGDADGCQLDDAVDMFEQVAVVAGNEGGAAPLVDEGEDRCAAGAVEIVGGFVEQEDVRRFEPEPGDGDARALAAAEAADGAGEVAFGEIDLRQCFGDAVFKRPVGFGHVFFGAFAPFEAGETREAISDAEGLGERDRVIRPALGEFADCAGDCDGTGCGFALPCDQRQERGLARTVAADEADAFGADGEG